jgi:uncharacterized protein
MTNALRFNVAGLLKETSGAAREFEVVAPASGLGDLMAGVRLSDDLRGQVRLMRSQRSIYARGRLGSRLAVECSRCLEATDVPVAFDVEAEYFPEIDIGTGQPLPAPDDDLAFTINANHELDLGEEVRQRLLLELPMQAICRDACKGLCPRCGADLNQGPCACGPEPADERLAPLRALLEGARDARP